MSLALTPTEIKNIKAKGVDIVSFQRLRKIWDAQLKRLNHKKTLKHTETN